MSSGKKKDLPKFIPEDQLDKIRAMLPSPMFRHFKQLYYELINRLNSRDVTSVRIFQKYLGERIEEVLDISNKFSRLIKRLKTDSEKGYRRIRMQNDLLERLQWRLKGKPQAPISDFPIGNELSKKSRKTEIKPQPSPVPAAATILAKPKTRPVAPTPSSPALNPVVAPKTPIEPPQPQFVVTLSKPAVIAESTIITQPKTEPSRIIDVIPELVVETTPTPPPENPEPRPLEEAVDKESVTESEASEGAPDRKAFDEARSRRLDDYIKKHQRSGKIDFREGNGESHDEETDF